MAERSALYFELRDALEAGGCPICTLRRQASDSYLNALIYEGVTDPALREELRDARGLCHRHAWRLAGQRGSVVGLAIVYHDVINTLGRILDEQGSNLTKRRGSRQALAERLGPRAECPACRLEKEATPRAAKTLLNYLHDPDIETGFRSAGGLCLPHLQLVLQHANDTQATTIKGWQSSIYQALRGQLAELIRKNDHRFHDETIGEEGDSWLRAIAQVTGAEDA